MDRPLILVTNDDGIEAPGIYRLIDYLQPLGAEIVCIAPDGPRSAQSMALTVNQALRVTRVADYNSVSMHKINGTPVDCVKLARHSILSRKPDLVVSGINHGSNASVNVLYSGTMGAASEGAVLGIPSIGFSLTSHSMDAEFGRCRQFVEKISRAVLKHGLPEGICLNVNIPAKCDPPTEMRVVRACRGSWSDEYRCYEAPDGKPFYWLTGSFINEEPDNTDTDEWCLSHGIVSVVPVDVEHTAPLSSLDFLR